MHELIKIADTDEKILLCSEVVLDLRPHITSENYLKVIKNMISKGYTLLYIETEGKAVAFAGYVRGFKLHRGDSIYIDDLNTLKEHRKFGYAGILMDAIFDFAKQNGISEIHLDSGVQRFDAHRFYLKRGFNITSHHFAIKINN